MRLPLILLGLLKHWASDPRGDEPVLIEEQGREETTGVICYSCVHQCHFFGGVVFDVKQTLSSGRPCCEERGSLTDKERLSRVFAN